MANDQFSRTAPRVMVTLPANLVRLFPGAVRDVELSASSVRDRLCDSRPAIRRHINVFVAGRRATLETPLAPGAEVTVLTAISGG